MKKKFEIEQIGIIHSPYKTKNECPIQGQVRPEGKGQIELFPEYEEGLLIFFYSLIVMLLDGYSDPLQCNSIYLNHS